MTLEQTQQTITFAPCDPARAEALFESVCDLIELICDAAYRGSGTPSMEAEYTRVCAWFREYYPSMQPLLGPYLPALPHVGQGDLLESIFTPTTLADVLTHDEGHLKERLLAIQDALMSWQETLPPTR